MYFALFALMSTPALAMPRYAHPGAAGWEDPMQCKPKETFGGVWTNFAQYIDTDVHVYLSDGFAETYQAHNGIGLTQDQARQIVQAAMETWNRESRGPVLVWGGEVSTRLLDDYRIDSTCRTFALNGGPDGGPVTQPAVLVDAVALSGSAGNRMMRNSSNSYCHNFTDREGLGTIVVAQQELNQLRPTMVHEFGHVLGLAHSFGDRTDPPFTGPMSVMQYSAADFETFADPPGSSYSMSRTFQGHLWPYDTDCVDDDLGDQSLGSMDARRRDLRQHWQVYEPASNDWNVEQREAMYAVSRNSGGAGATDVEGELSYPLVMNSPTSGTAWLRGATDDDLQAGAGSDGVVNLSSTWWALDAPFAVDSHLPITPFSIRSWGVYAFNAAMAEPLVSEAFESVQAIDLEHLLVDDYDPPPWVVSAGYSMGDALWTNDLMACPLAGACSIGTEGDPVQSHAAIRTAWDPQDGDQIYASVATRDCYHGGGNDDSYGFANPFVQGRCGGITVYAGTVAAGVWGALTAKPSTPTAYELDVPSYGVMGGDMSNEYKLITHVAPALTCGPAGEGVAATDGGSNYNCLLAWTDHGSPDGHVLTAWFRVVADRAEWHRSVDLVQPYRRAEMDFLGNWYEPGGEQVTHAVQTQSDLSAAFFDNRYWIAFKSSAAGDEETVNLVQTDYGGTSWYRHYVLEDTAAVDAPTFLWDPEDDSREVALAWTEQ